MAINHHFQGGNGIGNTNEKKLYEDLIIEGLKIYGHDVYYLPRTLVNQDLILGEDTLSKFDDSYLIEMYVEKIPTRIRKISVLNIFDRENTLSFWWKKYMMFYAYDSHNCFDFEPDSKLNAIKTGDSYTIQSQF